MRVWSTKDLNLSPEMRLEIVEVREALLVRVENTRILNPKEWSSFGEGWHTRILNLRDRWLAQGWLSAAWAHNLLEVTGVELVRD